MLKDKKNPDESSKISEEDWITHFKSLLYTKNPNQCNQSIPDNNNDNLNTFTLDCEITEKEIQNHISKLKSHKAPGIDGIVNEMIKVGRFYLVPIFKKVFNDILNSGHFPSIWNIGLIKPIYKKGDHSSPGNYRGITLTSCLGKLFTSILQTRLTNFLEENHLLNSEQFGFRPNLRTTDNLFILNQLIQKQFASGKKLYVCFIDYEKAFDSVWQPGLLHKITTMGINGKFFNIIQSMYTTISSSVLLEGNTFSDNFMCNKGIRQGDGLSPVLFSIFMNDLPDFLRNANCKGVNMNDHNFNCLMYADDLLLLSESADDLQHSINSLHNYSQEWKLKVNIAKTKVMIFNKQGRTINDHFFKCDNEQIEVVSKQTYLGLNFTPSGKFTYSRETLVKKGNKALASIRRMLSNCDYVPVTTYCKLFDSLIKPMLLYGSEIWGPELLQYKTPFDKSLIEQFHLKFCKIILNIPWYTSNDMCRAELGRFSMNHDIQSNIYSYYLRLKDNKNILLKNAFQFATSHSTDFNKACIKLLPLENRFPPSTNIAEKKNIKLKRKKMLKLLQESFANTWLDRPIQNNNDRITGKILKTKYCMEPYLDSVKNQLYRNTITKLRLGVHKLRVQTGKYEDNGKPIPIDKRLCTFCKENEIENERHFIGFCHRYSDIRKHYFKQISEINKEFSTFNLHNKVRYILEAKNNTTSTIIGKFISQLFTERNKPL